jgi:hypothetical protein
MVNPEDVYLCLEDENLRAMIVKEETRRLR